MKEIMITSQHWFHHAGHPVVLQWRIPISGDPISSFFCMLQELAIDQLTLRFVVIHVSNSKFFYQYL
jgi:hypothetical protein